MWEFSIEMWVGLQIWVEKICISGKKSVGLENSEEKNGNFWKKMVGRYQMTPGTNFRHTFRKTLPAPPGLEAKRYRFAKLSSRYWLLFTDFKVTKEILLIKAIVIVLYCSNRVWQVPWPLFWALEWVSKYSWKVLFRYFYIEALMSCLDDKIVKATTKWEVRWVTHLS